MRGESLDFIFEEDEASGVLEGLGPGIAFQAIFGNPRGDVRGLGGRDAGSEKEGAGAFGLFGVEEAAPAEVAGFALGKAGPWHEPTFEMLGAGRELEGG